MWAVIHRFGEGTVALVAGALVMITALWWLALTRDAKKKEVRS